MALIKRDTINPNKMEQVTPSQGLQEALRMAALGYDTQEQREHYELEELQQIVGRLLDTLSTNKVLSDREVVGLLGCYNITYGAYVGETPQG